MNLPNPGRGQASESEAALRVASRRAKFIPPLEAEGFLWLICKTIRGERLESRLWSAAFGHQALPTKACLYKKAKESPSLPVRG